jgi:hypothetical protein
MDDDKFANHKSANNLKLIPGAIILVVGFLLPLLIPFVLKLEISAAAKSVISGLLAFGIPELFMFLAVIVMGRPGYDYIKGKAGKYLRRFLSIDHVSRNRYNFGLVLFCIPIAFGILQPYLAHYIPFLKELPLWSHISLDVIFIIAIFVLGGDFWDKLSGLFQYKARISREN